MLNTEAILEEIAEKVVRKIRQKEKQALVVFTGGAIGFRESVQELKKLQADNWQLKVVLSHSAEYVLTEELIKKELSIETVLLESENKGLQTLYQDHSFLIIPVLTMNTAAKVSMGICDSLTTNLVSKFIMDGLPIIAAKDACTTDHPVRLQYGTGKTPSSYTYMFHDYLTKLDKFGINLVDAKDIYQTACYLMNRKSYQ